GKPIAHKIGEAELRAWWRPCDLLPDVVEQIIDESSSLESTVERVLQDTSLLTMATGRPGHRTPCALPRVPPREQRLRPPAPVGIRGGKRFPLPPHRPREPRRAYAPSACTGAWPRY